MLLPGLFCKGSWVPSWLAGLAGLLAFPEATVFHPPSPVQSFSSD